MPMYATNLLYHIMLALNKRMVQNTKSLTKLFALLTYQDVGGAQK